MSKVDGKIYIQKISVKPKLQYFPILAAAARVKMIRVSQIDSRT